MSSSRSIQKIVTAHRMMMGKTHIKQALPTNEIQQISPFLLLHHFGPTTVAPGTDPLDVGPHPHRGFEPVTFLYSGGIRHRDSRDNTGLLRGGDVQWMTAGRGIIHSELASPEFIKEGGTMEGIQLWVNLPKADKMVQPRYQDIKSNQIPVNTSDGVEVRVVAGKYGDATGPAQTYSPILALQLELLSNSELSIPLPEHWNAFIYLLSGQLLFGDGKEAHASQLVHFAQDGEMVSLSASLPTRILLMAGEPIDEPVAQHGPFVMNTQTEILEAMRDYQMGKMGVFVDQ